MLTNEERQEIEREIAIYPRRESACIEALKTVQRHRGWISDDAVKDVAEHLGMSADAVDNVATFYNLIFRKPVGAHVVFVCASVSCWLMGYESIKDRISARLGIDYGQTTRDDAFTLLPIQCLGACDRAPALMIDRDLWTDLTTDDVDRILAEYWKKPDARGTASYPKH